MIFKRKKRGDPKKIVLNAIATVNTAQLEIKRAEWRLRGMASRIPEAKTLLEKIYFYEFLLEKIKIRLNTILISGVVTRDLVEPLYEAIKNSSEALRGMPPTLSSSLLELESLLGSLYESLPEMPEVNMLAAEKDAAIREDAQNILSAARREAKRRVEKLGAS